MLGKLFNRGSGRPNGDCPARAPDGRRIYAVGDIHGRSDLLVELHEKILEDAADATGLDMVVVYVGDYVDRGPGSSEVIDLLLDDPLPGFEAVHLLGNHEAMLLEFLDDPGSGSFWLPNGGDVTLLSYGVTLAGGMSDEDEEWLGELSAALRESLPERHMTFLTGLATSHVEGDYLFVHAGVRPSVPLDRQQREDLIWIRDEFLRSSVDHGKVVVHGHTIVRRPEVRANRIAIDTGAFATDRLTCLVAEGGDRRFLET